MDIQFTRGRLTAVSRILQEAKNTLMYDADCVSVACRDEYCDDPEWQVIATRLMEAAADIQRAREDVEEANTRLWQQYLHGN
ncbi:MAG: hypothetical protein AB1609_17295 [Bacillota bacterium]